MKKIREGCNHGGAYTWPLWILQLVLEMLVHGAPPSSIPPSIVSHITITNPGMEIKEIPCVSYVRKCRSILRIIGETLASYRLAKAKKWQQLFTDGTSRRQTAIQNLIIGIEEDSVLKNIVLSSSIILVGESSEQ